MNYRTADFSSLVAAINNVAAEAGTTFGQLTPAQLNWKPSAERWSVAQCFEHLINSNKGYFRSSIPCSGKETDFQGNAFRCCRYLGGLLIKSLDPATVRKLKAPKKFEPAQSDISATVIDDFITQQTTIVEK
jgi:hypothetical protein